MSAVVGYPFEGKLKGLRLLTSLVLWHELVDIVKKLRRQSSYPARQGRAIAKCFSTQARALPLHQWWPGRYLCKGIAAFCFDVLQLTWLMVRVKRNMRAWERIEKTASLCNRWTSVDKVL
jgi:hypothetical protein